MERNKYGGYFSSSSTAETNLTGISYSNILPDFNEFKKLIGEKLNFIAVQKFELGASDSDVSTDSIYETFDIINIENNNGIVTFSAKLKGENALNNFQLVTFDQNSFNVACKFKGTAYNFKIQL